MIVARKIPLPKPRRDAFSDGPTYTSMKAIIIGAGRGRRLMPTTAETPKCFAEVRLKKNGPHLKRTALAIQKHTS